MISGIDSLAVGETQVAGQVREAFDIAQQAGAVGFHLGRLFDQAFHANKRVRSETGIGEGSISISHMAVDLALQIFGDLASKEVLVLGAGETSTLTIQHLKGHGASSIIVCNRTAEKARALAEEFGLRAKPWEELSAALATADIVMSSTASAEPIIEAGPLLEIMHQRGNSPLFIVDLAAPRDVEAQVADIYNVFLYNIDDLERVIEDNLARREHEVVRARQLIGKEVGQFEAWLKSLDARKVIVDLRSQYDAIRQNELERLRTKSPEIDDAAWARIDAFSHRLMNKYLHQPTSQLRNAEEEHHPTVIELVRRIFNLGHK